MRITTRIAVWLAAGGLMVGALTACEMKVLPLSAQAGSTIAVPLGDATFLDTFGYGGDPDDPGAVIDYQRGQLFLRLDTDLDPTNGAQCPDPPCELFARAVSAVVGAESTFAAISGANAGRQVVGIFDIPPDTLPGTYGLILYRRNLDEDGLGGYTEEELQLTGSSAGNPVHRKLMILPNGLDPDDPFNPTTWAACGGAGEPPACGPDAIIGAPTPYQYWDRPSGKSGYIWLNGGSSAYLAYPNPELLMNVPDVGNDGVFALEVDIYYPSDKITMLDAVPPIAGTNFVPPNVRPIVLFEDDADCSACPPEPVCMAGTLPANRGRISVTMIVKPGFPSGNDYRINQLGLVFDVNVNPDGSFSRLDPNADICTDTLSAADEGGDPFGSLPVVTPLGII